MSIRPIDLVTIAPKSQEVSQVHFNEMRGRDHAEAAVAQNFQRTEEHNKQRTVQAKKGDTREYKFDAKDSSGNSYYGNGKKKDKGKEENEKEKNRPHNPYAGGFDIKI